ncbi:MAG: phage holin family protein [Puniceicoccales bacterium]|jgi:putative membrane protein|nr:phage holin family protein [Puniceicoccales bacterium]
MIENRTWRQWGHELLALALGVLAATRIVNGIYCDDLVSLLCVVLVLSFLNMLARPFLTNTLLLLFLPLTIATVGLAAIFVLWIVNSLLFYFASSISPAFRVDSFGDAMLGALVVSGVSWVISRLLGGGKPPSRQYPPDAGRTSRRRREEDDDDVIDV